MIITGNYLTIGGTLIENYSKCIPSYSHSMKFIFKKKLLFNDTRKIVIKSINRILLCVILLCRIDQLQNANNLFSRITECMKGRFRICPMLSWELKAVKSVTVEFSLDRWWRLKSSQGFDLASHVQSHTRARAIDAFSLREYTAPFAWNTRGRARDVRNHSVTVYRRTLADLSTISAIDDCLPYLSGYVRWYGS